MAFDPRQDPEGQRLVILDALNQLATDIGNMEAHPWLEYTDEGVPGDMSHKDTYIWLLDTARNRLEHEPYADGRRRVAWRNVPVDGSVEYLVSHPLPTTKQHEWWRTPIKEAQFGLKRDRGVHVKGGGFDQYQPDFMVWVRDTNKENQ